MISGSGPPRINLFGRETALALLLFTALTVLFAYPLSLHPATLRFPTGPDGDLGWYILGWDAHAFLHRPWRIFDANIYYPQRLTLAYGENVIGIALFAAPIIWTTGNLLLAANLVCMLATILCGLGAYVLARRVGLSVAAAIICGIIWECAPPRFYRIGQMTLSSVEWIPFALASLHAYFDEGHPRHLKFAAAFVSLQMRSSGYGAVFMAVSLMLFAVYRVLLGEPIRLARRFRDLGVVGAALLAPGFLVFLPYRAVQHEVGLKRGLGTWGVNYDSFLASPSHLHKFLLSLFTATDINATASSFLFPGYVPIVLAILAFGWTRRRGEAEHDRAGRGVWTRATLAVELALATAAAIAVALTAGTLIPLRAGTAHAAMPRSASIAWIVCAVFAAAGAAMAAARRAPTDTLARHRRPLALALTMALVWSILSAARSSVPAGDGLKAAYFANTTCSGPPAFSVVDARPTVERVAARWNGDPPDEFSACWTGFLTVSRAGDYTFTLASDDGSELSIDNHFVVDNSGRHSLATRSGSIHLRRGSHAVLLRYSQFGGDTALAWSWAVDNGRPSPVPAWALSQSPTEYGTALFARLLEGLLLAATILAVIAGLRYVFAALTRGRGEAVAERAAVVRRDAVVFYLLLTIVMFGLALGPPYGLWQYVYWLPGFNFIRATSRFTIAGLLGLAVLAGAGFDRLSRRLTLHARTRLAAAIALALIVEYAAMPMAVQPGHVDIPSIDRWLDTVPKPFVVAEVPVQSVDSFGAFERQEVEYMLHSTAHWQKTVHGYSGWRTGFHQRLYTEMQFFPDDTSLASLSDLAVTYVVVHPEAYAPGEWPAVEARLKEYPSRLRLEHVEGSDRVYALMQADATR